MHSKYYSKIISKRDKRWKESKKRWSLVGPRPNRASLFLYYQNFYFLILPWAFLSAYLFPHMKRVSLSVSTFSLTSCLSEMVILNVEFSSYRKTRKSAFSQAMTTCPKFSQPFWESQSSVPFVSFASHTCPLVPFRTMVSSNFPIKLS